MSTKIYTENNFTIVETVIGGDKDYIPTVDFDFEIDGSGYVYIFPSTRRKDYKRALWSDLQDELGAPIGLTIVEVESFLTSLSQSTSGGEVVLSEGVLVNGGVINIPANLSEYRYLLFEAERFGAANVSVSERVKVSAAPDSRVAMHHDDLTGYIFFDIDSLVSIATLTCTVSFTSGGNCRMIGVK